MRAATLKNSWCRVTAAFALGGIGVKCNFTKFCAGRATTPEHARQWVQMALTKAEQIAQAVVAESEKPRIGRVVFYGVCCVCGHTVDVTNRLEFNHKEYLINEFGVEKIDDKWVCKEKLPLPNCPFCKKPPF